MVDCAVAEYGRLDMAFNNAGIQVPPPDAADEPIESFERASPRLTSAECEPALNMWCA